MSKSRIIKICSCVISLGILLPFTIFENANAAMISGDKFVGNIIGSSVPSNFDTYWNQVTPENGTKWGSVESTRDTMNLSNADTIYKYAKEHRIPFKFHTLVWGSQQPNWISSLSASDQKAEVTEWIQAAGQKYSGADFVDVVNEPLHAKPSYKDAIGGDGTTGWDWVVWSFEQARAAFPNSKLLINEYGIISDPNATANYVKIINILKSRGLIDGIGIQCHQFNMDTVSVSTMKSVLNTLSSTGLPIYVSELDITGDDATQLARYKEKFPVLWENSNVKGITLWGYIQGQTWINNTHLISSTGVERPALTWLKSYLAKNNTDVEVPTAPTNLTCSKTSLGAVSLSWTASTDNIGVTSYDIYNGSTLVGTSATTSYTVTGLSPNTIYSFTVIAKDAAGNSSGASSKLSVTTNTKALKGDADSSGEVNVLDYVLLQKYINNPTSVSINSVNSDLNSDARINTADLFELRKIVLAG